MYFKLLLKYKYSFISRQFTRIIIKILNKLLTKIKKQVSGSAVQ